MIESQEPPQEAPPQDDVDAYLGIPLGVECAWPLEELRSAQTKKKGQSNFSVTPKFQL